MLECRMTKPPMYRGRWNNRVAMSAAQVLKEVVLERVLAATDKAPVLLVAGVVPQVTLEVVRVREELRAVRAREAVADFVPSVSGDVGGGQQRHVAVAARPDFARRPDEAPAPTMAFGG